MHINGVLPLIENIFLNDQSNINFSHKVEEELNQIKIDKGEENITILTSNTGFLVSSTLLGVF